MKTRIGIKRHRLTLLTIAAASVLVGGCNLFGGIDSTDSKEDAISAAQAMMDEGKCSDAVTKLNTVSPADDRSNQILGWAHLCVAGATITKVGKTLFTYSSSTNDLTVVGKLADSLIPITAANITSINAAITAFTAQGTSTDRSFNLAFANIIKAAAYIAKASADSVRARRSDLVLTASTCAAATCASSPASCAASSVGTLSDAETDIVASALVAASSNASSAGLGSGTDLSRQLALAVSVGAYNITRCGIVQQMISP